MATLDTTYQHILETMNDGVMTLSENGEILLFNQAAASILGMDVDGVVGQNLMAVFFAEDERNDEFTQVVLNAAMNKGETVRAAVPYVRADGKQLHLELASSYLDKAAGERFSGVVLVFKDVTKLRELYDDEKDLTTRLSTAYQDLEAQTEALENKMRRSKRTQRVSLGIALAVVIAALIFYMVRYKPFATFFDSSSGEQSTHISEANLIEVRSAPVSLQLSFTGNFEPLSNVNIVSPFTGRILSKSFVLGEEVKKGTPLFELNTSELLIKMRKAESEAIKARQEYDKLLNWENSDEMQKAQQSYIKAQKALATSKNKYSENKYLFEKGVIPEDELTASASEYENYGLDFKAAKAAMAAERRKGAGENIRVAKISLDNALYTYDDLQKKINRAACVAPVGGIVVLPKASKNEEPKNVEVGGSYNEGEIIIAIGDLAGYTVRTKVDAVDLVKIRLGQPVTITGDAFAGTVLKGSIRSISSQATKTNSGGAKFDVVVVVEGITPEQRKRIRLGMVASMEVTVYDNPKAMLVPLDALKKRGKRYVVIVMTKTGMEERPVTPGITTLNSVEILEGLSPGDKIMPGGR